MKSFLLLFILFLGSFTLNAQLPSCVSKNGLVGYWTFDNTFDDVSGNKNITVTNGALLVKDKFENNEHACYFNGSSFISIRDNNRLRPKQITINIMVKPEKNSGLVNPLFYKGEFEVYELDLLFFGIKQKSNCGSYSGGGWVNTEKNSNNFIPNKWYMITGSFDGKILSYYVNGVLVKSKKTEIAEIDNCPGGEDFKIGARHKYDKNFFKGTVDDFGVWNRALDKDEILKMYNGFNNTVSSNDQSKNIELINKCNGLNTPLDLFEKPKSFFVTYKIASIDKNRIKTLVDDKDLLQIEESDKTKLAQNIPIAFNVNSLTMVEGLYTGQVIKIKTENGKILIPHGKGEFISDVNEYLHYNGEWSKGSFSGEGKLNMLMLYLGIDIGYEGSFLNGQLHGKGKVNWDHIPYSKLRAFSYEGTFVNNVIDEGIGSFRYLDSSIYTGSIKNSMRNGKGKLEFSESNNTFCFFNGYLIKAKYYDGFWENDFMEGKGELNYYSTLNQNNSLNKMLLGNWVKNQFSGKAEIAFRNGKVYNFEFINNFPQGNGTITQGNKIKINGSFNDKSFSGNGFFTFEDGSSYEGEIKNSKKNGQGVYNDANRNIYTGFFADDKCTGTAKIYNAEWSYQGEVVLNVPRGKGIKIFTNADTFDGVFTDDKFTGIGKINNSDWSYDGEVVNYQPNGKGVKIFANGDTLSGTWNEYGFNGVGKRREAAVENSDGFYYTEGTWKNGQLNGEGIRFFKMRSPSSSGEDEIFVDATYTGQFINGIFNGKGNLQFNDITYCSIDGDWINGLCPKGQISFEYGGSESGRCVTSYKGDLSSNFNKQGFGTFTDCDGNTYVGYFENDSENGQGKLTYKNGKIEQGTFVNGVFQIPFICKKVTIGNQVWMSENLNVSTYRNGDAIPQVQDQEKWANLTTGAWCYYENKTANGTKYGKLYNWYAVNDSRGLAPFGYHIPTDAEWSILNNYLGDNTAGKKMKSTSGWQNNGNGTNTSGFGGLPGGGRGSNGNFNLQGTRGYWWSSSGEYQWAWPRKLLGLLDALMSGSEDKPSGMSVRCVKDK